jgi:trans-aconitate 2-methyltransferase
MDWNAKLYREFEEERTRPARELLARIDLDSPSLVYDLGCGPGNSTALLRARYPSAEVIGIDTSPDMLKTATERLPDCRFEQADIAGWHPEKPPQVIYANAALHWVPDHPRLVSRLFAALAPGGVLAFQMPDNLDEPSHRLMRETAIEGAWSKGIREGESRPTLPLDAYYDLLAPGAVTVDVWRTAYRHPLPSATAIVAWLSSTGLRPFLAPLSQPERQSFLRLYEQKIDQAYPPRSDGKRLLLFPRIFVVAMRPA